MLDSVIPIWEMIPTDYKGARDLRLFENVIPTLLNEGDASVEIKIGDGPKLGY